jgi:hypothetical protein
MVALEENVVIVSRQIIHGFIYLIALGNASLTVHKSVRSLVMETSSIYL